MEHAPVHADADADADTMHRRRARWDGRVGGTVPAVTAGSSQREDAAGNGRRRRYDSPIRRQRAAETRERIVSAGSELVHEFPSWDWRELTFRAVAERAGVGVRTVYRNFPTERHLRDAVVQRLEEEAGVTYEDVTLDDLSAVAARVFTSLHSFAVQEAVQRPDDATFEAADERRRGALRRSVAGRQLQRISRAGRRPPQGTDGKHGAAWRGMERTSARAGKTRP